MNLDSNQCKVQILHMTYYTQEELLWKNICWMNLVEGCCRVASINQTRVQNQHNSVANKIGVRFLVIIWVRPGISLWYFSKDHDPLICKVCLFVSSSCLCENTQIFLQILVCRWGVVSSLFPKWERAKGWCLLLHLWH